MVDGTTPSKTLVWAVLPLTAQFTLFFCGQIDYRYVSFAVHSGLHLVDSTYHEEHFARDANQLWNILAGDGFSRQG